MASNDVFGDPDVGNDVKCLIVRYSVGEGPEVEAIRPQGQKLVLPEDPWLTGEIQRLNAELTAVRLKSENFKRHIEDTGPRVFIGHTQDALYTGFYIESDQDITNLRIEVIEHDIYTMWADMSPTVRARQRIPIAFRYKRKQELSYGKVDYSIFDGYEEVFKSMAANTKDFSSVEIPITVYCSDLRGNYFKVRWWVGYGIQTTIKRSQPSLRMGSYECVNVGR